MTRGRQRSRSNEGSEACPTKSRRNKEADKRIRGRLWNQRSQLMGRGRRWTCQIADRLRSRKTVSGKKTARDRQRGKEGKRARETGMEESHGTDGNLARTDPWRQEQERRQQVSGGAPLDNAVNAGEKGHAVNYGQLQRAKGSDDEERKIERSLHRARQNTSATAVRSLRAALCSLFTVLCVHSACWGLPTLTRATVLVLIRLFFNPCRTTIPSSQLRAKRALTHTLQFFIVIVLCVLPPDRFDISTQFSLSFKSCS